MRLPSQLAALALFLPSALANDKPYSTWMTDSFITRGVSLTRWYTEATFYRGVEPAPNHPGLPTSLPFLNTSLSPVLTPTGIPRDWSTPALQLDHTRIGSTLLYLYTATSLPI